MPILKYRYYCTFQGTTTEVFPIGNDDFKIISEKEGKEKFHRRKFSGKLIFIGEDYSYFKAILDSSSRCDSISFEVFRSCDNGHNYSTFWQGYFTVLAGRFNVDKCRFEVEPKVLDEYSCILDNADQEFNILNASPQSSLIGSYDPQWEETICIATVTIPEGLLESVNDCVYLKTTHGTGLSALAYNANCVLPNVGWMLYSTVIANGVDLGNGTWDFAVTSVWRREVKTTLDLGGSPNPPAGSGWINYATTTIGGDAATVWVRQPFDAAYNTYTISYTDNCGVRAELELPSTTVSYTNGRALYYVVSYILDQLSCSLTFRSDFFQLNPYNVSANNYVTGTTNRVDDLVFFHASDFVDPTASEKATILNLSFNGLMKILRGMFNVYWIVDEATGVFRIEHTSWSGFSNSVGIDVTADATKALHVRGTNDFSFKTEDMPQEEAFKWQQAEDVDFVGKSIFYDSDCVTKGLRTETGITNVTTDTEFIYYNPTSASKEGIVIVARDNSDNTIDFETGRLSGITKQNAHLSWANLHYNYHRHGRVLSEGSMNNTATTFLSTVKLLKQVPISFPICCEAFNPSELIATDLGDGEVIKAEESLKTGIVTIELLYP